MTHLPELVASPPTVDNGSGGCAGRWCGHSVDSKQEKRKERSAGERSLQVATFPAISQLGAIVRQGFPGAKEMLSRWQEWGGSCHCV